MNLRKKGVNTVSHVFDNDPTLQILSLAGTFNSRQNYFVIAAFNWITINSFSRCGSAIRKITVIRLFFFEKLSLNF